METAGHSRSGRSNALHEASEHWHARGQRRPLARGLRHWFDGERALAEIARVLRPRGALVLLWNLPAGPAVPSTAGVDQLIVDYSVDAGW